MTHRKTAFAYATTAAASSLALVLVMGGSAAADHDPTTNFTGSCAAVQDLRVAAEYEGNDYDRDAFGDYDRDALLAASEEKYGDNYYSVFDNVHYYFDDYGGKEQADDEVDVDHAVALAEAWDSGAHEWSEAKRDRFAGDTANLTLLTDGVNQGAKSSNDIAEWVPPYDGAVGGYVTRWVNVKSTYDLTVDQAELDALLTLTGCSGGGAPPADDGNQGNTGDSGNNNDGNGDASGGEDTNGGDEKPAADAPDDEDDLAPVPTPAEAHIEVTG